MRFRKSLKIAKGVKLNLSKTGASFTLGTGKGLSFNLGNKGAYLNWSIPGTQQLPQHLQQALLLPSQTTDGRLKHQVLSERAILLIKPLTETKRPTGIQNIPLRTEKSWQGKNALIQSR